MIDLFSPGDVRAMDQRAFAAGVAALDLMERAAGHLARGVVSLCRPAYGSRIALLCGKGNNGGDGIAAARILARQGAFPLVALVAGDDNLSEDAAAQLERWRAMGGRVVDSVEVALREADVAVDCLLGTGASGEPREPYRSAIVALQAFDGPVVACDVPTGVDAETGAVPGQAVRADVTVTLGAHKVGLWLWPARAHCGRLVLGELDIRRPEDAPDARVPEAPDVRALLPDPTGQVHKYSRGTVLVVAGSPGMSGAATMVARGAMAAGAGLVTVAGSAQEQVASTVPEALTVALPADDDERAFALLEEQLDSADAVVVGPGLSTSETAVALVRRIVEQVQAPLVLDADGLNAFRHQGDALAKHASRLLVLTPHERELGRIATADRDERAALWRDRVHTVPEQARAWDAVVVAKGPGTLVAAPDGRRWVNPTGTPALATGGTGDVLAGMLGALLAQRADPEAVMAGVYLHGLAGQAAADRAHVRSVTALGVAEAVPAALHRLGESAA